MGLAFTLYACSLVNFPSVIAHYNVEHSREISGKGLPLDVGYLASLGPQVIPALNRFLDTQPHEAWRSTDTAKECVSILEEEFKEQNADWRSWSLQNARLKKYLKNRHILEPRNGHTQPR